MHRTGEIKVLSRNGQNILSIKEKAALVKMVIAGGSVNKIAASAGIGHSNLST